MDRINTSTKAPDLFGAGKHGFRNGDLPNGIAPTDLNALFCNGVQEEPARAIEGAGIVLDPNDLGQLLKAIKRFSGAGVKTVAAGATALTADDAGLVLVNAAGGNVTLTLPAANVAAGLPIGFEIYRTDTTTNVVTVNRAGANTIDGVNSFTMQGQYAYRKIRADGASAWSTTAVSASSSVLQSISASAAGNVLTVTVNPASLDFRSPTLTVGVPNTRTWSAPLTLQAPATATLGTVSGQPCRIAVIVMDNAGSLELGLVNLAGGVDLSETGLISSTVMNAASDFANVVYSATARANLPYRVVGCVDLTPAVAGNWTAPTLVQGMGGQALTSMSGYGAGQVLQDVTGSRALTTVYYNTTPRVRKVYVNLTMNAGLMPAMVIGGLNMPAGATVGSTYSTGVSWDIPPYTSYSLSSSGVSSISSWREFG